MSAPGTVTLSRGANKDLRRLPKHIQVRLVRAATGLGDNPLVGQKLQGDLAGRRRFRVGDYRIIYEHDSKRRLVVIVAIRSRGGAYR